MSDLYAACVGRFYEDLSRRLVEGASRVFLEAGGSVDVHEVPGAFHGFDGIAPKAAISRAYFDSTCAALRGAMTLVG